MEDRSTCPVLHGQPIRIDLAKGRRPLGVKIIGGSDTSVKSVIVYEIYDGGAVAADGRLAPGDHVLEVNGEDLRPATHLHAIRSLRRAVSEVLTLVVLRPGPPSTLDEDLHDQLTVDVVKKAGRGLGLSIVSRRNNSGIIIADIVKGGVAESDGRLVPGDQILSANGEDMCNVPHDCAAAFLKSLAGKVSLTVARLKPGLTPGGHRGAGGLTLGSLRKSDSVTGDCKNLPPFSSSRRLTKSANWSFDFLSCHNNVCYKRTDSASDEHLDR
jgi:C-terminal processing protease CtpA/Prc